MKDEWHYGGRYYHLLNVSGQDYSWELEEVAPTPSRGTVLSTNLTDDGEFTFEAHTTDPLPMALVHRFVTEMMAEGRHAHD